MNMIEFNNKSLPIIAQCKLLGLCRSSLYYSPLINGDSEIANLIKEIYLKSDCRYGYRKITAALQDDHKLIVNHKKVLRIMQDMSIQGLYPRKYINTTIKDSHKIFPYLLNGVTINHINQVWATDITYSVPGAQGEYGYSNEPQIYLKYPVRAQGIMVH